MSAMSSSSLGLNVGHRVVVSVLSVVARWFPPTAVYPTRLSLGGCNPVRIVAGGTRAALRSTLPSCPYAPPGVPVMDEYQPPPPYKIYLRCHHDPSHCWDKVGQPMVPCP